MSIRLSFGCAHRSLPLSRAAATTPTAIALAMLLGVSAAAAFLMRHACPTVFRGWAHNPPS
jgi:hypothetical protein